MRDTQRLGMNIESQSCRSVAFEIFLRRGQLIFHAQKSCKNHIEQFSINFKVRSVIELRFSRVESALRVREHAPDSCLCPAGTLKCLLD
mgnify:CR=1 FL=1